jgi:uncharacterized protein (DUF4415 family)
MSKTTRKRVLVMPTVEENRRIVEAAKRDPDAQPLTSAQLKSMVPLKSLRGRPKLEKPKQLVSVRYNPEVVEYFKKSGEGWQSRMNTVLLEYIHAHPRRNRKAT